MRLTILAVLLVLMLGCTQQPQNVTNQTVQQPVNTTDIPANANPFIISVPNTTIVNQTAANSTNISASNQTANITASNESTTANSTPLGLVFGDGKYSIVLDDVSLTGNVPCGIFSIRENNSIIDKMVICQSESQIWVGPDGHRFRIRADKVAAGYTGQAMWAQVEIFG